MIKDTDLRLGNYILFKLYGEGDGEIGAMKAGDFGRFSNDEYHPIPLTPEILKQCGFVRPDQGFSNYYRLDKFEVDHDSNLNMGIFMASNFIVHVYYLHQLQNLYHSLTGQELEIKIPQTT